TTALFSMTLAHAATIYPIDRATILVSSPFDLKVEFDNVVAESEIELTINGRPAAEVLGQDPRFIEKEEGVEASAIRINGIRIAEPGTYTVVARAGDEAKSVTWEVYDTPDTPVARNVIFLI